MIFEVQFFKLRNMVYRSFNIPPPPAEVLRNRVFCWAFLVNCPFYLNLSLLPLSCSASSSAPVGTCPRRKSWQAGPMLHLDQVASVSPIAAGLSHTAGRAEPVSHAPSAWLLCLSEATPELCSGPPGGCPLPLLLRCRALLWSWDLVRSVTRVCCHAHRFLTCSLGGIWRLRNYCAVAISSSPAGTLNAPRQSRFSLTSAPTLKAPAWCPHWLSSCPWRSDGITDLHECVACLFC